MGLRNTKALLSLIGFAAAVMVGGNAKADIIGTLNAQYYNVLPSQVHNVSYPAGSINTYAGQFNWRRLDNNESRTDPQSGTIVGPGTWDTSKIAPNASFATFCIQVNQTLQNNYHSFSVQDDVANAPLGGSGSMGPVRADRLSKFLGTFYPIYQAGINATTAAGMQLAVWEIVFENSNNPYDITQGVVKSNTADTGRTQAATYLSQFTTLLNTPSHVWQEADLVAFVDSGDQDQVYFIGLSEIPGVPLPSVAWGVFALIGVITLGARHARAMT